MNDVNSFLIKFYFLFIVTFFIFILLLLMYFYKFINNIFAWNDCMLVLQLLMKENLDLKLTPYKVLATSGNHGQFLLYNK